jgi:hypothetical protein
MSKTRPKRAGVIIVAMVELISVVIVDRNLRLSLLLKRSTKMVMGGPHGFAGCFTELSAPPMVPFVRPLARLKGSRVKDRRLYGYISTTRIFVTGISMEFQGDRLPGRRRVHQLRDSIRTMKAECSDSSVENPLMHLKRWMDFDQA